MIIYFDCKVTNKKWEMQIFLKSGQPHPRLTNGAAAGTAEIL
jgi:hypothetical protein